jgi:hypothetical protein
VKGFDFIRRPCLFIEAGQQSIHVFDGVQGLELPLERQENGRLTGACKEKVALGLREFLKSQPWHPRRRAFCAIAARGVSLRRLALPSAPAEELQRLIALQIESEFPLPPDQLAWGYVRIDPLGRARPSTNGQVEIVLVAVKKEVIEEFTDILDRCGVVPVFTLAALARSSMCRQPSPSYAVLDIGPQHSELVHFDDGVPSSVRILPWGYDNLLSQPGAITPASPDTAGEGSVPVPDQPAEASGAIDSALDSLAVLLTGSWAQKTLYVTGKNGDLHQLAARLAGRLGDSARCEWIEVATGPGRSAAVIGLQKYYEKNGGGPPLTLQVKGPAGAAELARPDRVKWAGLAVLLVLGNFLFPYAEALLLKPRLARKLAQIQASRDKLTAIDQELSFLQYLKKNQPPYSDALMILANATPPGSRIDSLSMNRGGELSLRGTIRGQEQVVEFRSKLINSGFFSTVVIPEQTPMPDRQSFVVRLTAQWKAALPPGARDLFPMPIPSTTEPKPKPAEPPPGISGALTNRGTGAPPVLRTAPPMIRNQ